MSMGLELSNHRFGLRSFAILELPLNSGCFFLHSTNLWKRGSARSFSFVS